MEFQSLGIDGVWIARSQFHLDDRGGFREWFRADELREKTDFDFGVVQANLSISKKGVLRGIHYSLSKSGQAKWVTCVAGLILDVVVDVRPTSPTFKKYVAVELSAERGESLVIAAGLGHAFLALEEQSAVSYLLTSEYSPRQEYSINPHDLELAIEWPKGNHSLSQQDQQAPTLSDRLAQGLLPK